MTKNKLLLLIFILLLSIPAFVRGTTIGEKTMVNLTPADGLSGETVYRVMTDYNGYTWIATTGGLSVYDGQHLLNFHIYDERGRCLEVRDLCETSDHTIYTATENGIYRLLPVSGVFQRILPEVKHPISLLAVGDTVYIGSEQGFLFYDGQQLHCQSVGVGSKGLDNIVRHYVRDRKGLIWFLSRYSLNSYDPKTGALTKHPLSKLLGEKLTLSTFDIANGLFVIGTRSNGLYVYDAQSCQARHVDGIGKIVTSVQTASDGLVAVATDGSGGCLLELKGDDVVVREQFSMDQKGMNRLPTNALYSFYRDANGINWLGTVRRGLVYNPFNGRLFQPMVVDGLSTIGMNVRCFLPRGSQMLLGLQEGLLLTDAKSHTHHRFSAAELGGHILNNIQWWQGRYIIGTFDGGIRCLDPLTKTISHQPWTPLLEKSTIGDIKIAPDSTLWIGCSDGLFIIRQDGTVRRFTEQNSHIIGGIIINITFDAKGNAWLTGAKGLSFFSAEGQEIVNADFPKGFFHNESYMKGTLGHDGLVYMRNGPSLFYTSSDMEQYGELKLPVRLTDKWCRRMVDDLQGRLWLASERGLLSIDYQGGQLIQLGKGEGLLGDQINEMSIDRQGRFWVATSDGLYYTSLEALRQYHGQNSKHITLYHILRGSDKLTPQEMSKLTENRKLQLSWNITSQPLQAKPILLDYAPQEDRIYEYQVDGGQWQLLNHGEVIDVRNLLLGYHQLTIRMAGMKSTETIYTLIVTPSAWAIIEAVLLLMAIGLLFWWYRYRKQTKVLLAERDEIEDALIESEALRAKSEELAETQEEQTQKYQKVKVDEQECEDIVRHMKEYIERERVFTNADLKMKDLADVLHLSAPKLSQVFNIYLNENYYEFINKYRLDEFKRLIAAGAYKRFTITALSEQCGFKKSNFFSTFRKVEGMSPAEYLKKQGVKV